MTTDKKTETKAAAPESKRVLPKGFEKKSSDVVGIWDEELGELYFIPKTVKVSDSKHSTHAIPRASCLIIGVLCRDTKLRTKDDGVVNGRKGDVVGLWYSPGMSDIIDCAGQEVFMYRDGEKDTGMPSPMKVYSVNTSGARGGDRLKVSADNRRESRHLGIPFEVPAALRNEPEAF